MEMECDEVKPLVSAEEKRTAGEDLKGQEEVLNCAAAEEEDSEVEKGKMTGESGVAARSDARSSDLPTKSEDGRRSMTPEVDMLDNALTRLTIFYAGRVHVFDSIPPEKVKEIMLIATAAATPNSGEQNKIGTDCPNSSPVLTRSPSLQSTAAVALPQAQLLSCKLQAGAELPIARRHSLQRFFEKRRDRLVSKNPYPTALKMADDTKTRVNVETSPGAGCFEKSSMLNGEFQGNTAARLA